MRTALALLLVLVVCMGAYLLVAHFADGDHLHKQCAKCSKWDHVNNMVTVPNVRQDGHYGIDAYYVWWRWEDGTMTVHQECNPLTRCVGKDNWHLPKSETHTMITVTNTIKVDTK